MNYYYLNNFMVDLDQECPTRGPLDDLVRPFSPLSSLTPFLKGGKIFLGKENFSREANSVERVGKILGGQAWQGQGEK